MSEIALYDLLRRIPEVSNDEAKNAVVDIASAKDVATKSDIKDMATKSDLDMGLAKLETRLVKQMYSMAGLIIGAIGLMFVIAGFIIRMA